MCAAAALASNFTKVTVLERDGKPGPQPRRAVAQSHHTHALLRRGQLIMDKLFPGAFDRLEADGASVGDMGEAVRWYHHGAWRARGELGIPIWFQSRPLLEWHLRERLAARANVELRFRCHVDAPLHARGRIHGVRLRDGEILDADLVVDAAGRGSRSPRWLSAWGYGEVAEERVELGLTYVSGLFELGPHARVDRGLMISTKAPVNRRGGIAFRVEGDRMMVTLFGYHGDRAPLDPAGFVEWSKTLGQPDIHELLAGARLVGKLRTHGMPYQQRRGYAAMKLPAGYLVLGDALCSFDPTFGQGMTVAAIQAEQLTKLRPGQRTKPVQRSIARATHVPWMMTSTEAYAWLGPQAEPPAGTAMAQQYLGRLFELAAHDLAAYRTLAQVSNMIRPAWQLLAPRMLARALLSRRPKLSLAPARPLPLERSAVPASSGIHQSPLDSWGPWTKPR
ncbi:putative epoxidase LasC [Enhygromyxa salina]|uniref:Putative epoxidase LasC n=1 Tax=Enhygromyxa salina TaxID=215803 RepID=A0A2S9XC48_9BACT|nr:tryptophan 7-halogenase [Enhygromyxa salina]PRP90428.1 putative epoxidase LasC [Enhygromyxa salina]